MQQWNTQKEWFINQHLVSTFSIGMTCLTLSKFETFKMSSVEEEVDKYNNRPFDKICFQ